MIRVFYSRKMSENGDLDNFCKKQNISLTAQSLLSFEAKTLEKQPKPYDVVFFASPRAFDFFVKQFEIKKTARVACIGSSTAKHIQAQGFDVHFTGQDSTKPKTVAKVFSSWLGDRHVLYPISNISNRSISRVLNPNQVQEFVIYNTILEPHTFKEPFDCLIFSSPSNAEAFLEKNSVKETQIVAAFGTTTQEFLVKNGFSSAVLENTTEKAVVNFIKSNVLTTQQ